MRCALWVFAGEIRENRLADDPRLEPFFAWKGQIGMIRHEDPGEDIFGPALKDRVAEFFEQLMPLYDYFNRFKN